MQRTAPHTFSISSDRASSRSSKSSMSKALSQHPADCPDVRDLWPVHNRLASPFGAPMRDLLVSIMIIRKTQALFSSNTAWKA